MRKFAGIMLGFCLLLGTASIVEAQDNSSATMAPPKVLVIMREFLKPGRSGTPHEKSESAFIQAFTAAKWPTQYLALESLTGKSRALFFTGYDSFDAWEKDNQATAKNAALSAALSRAAVADGDLLDSSDESAWVYREDQSLHAATDIPHMRYFAIELFHVRPGHEKDWGDAVKLVKDAYEKSVPDAHWAMYEAIYGVPAGTYIVITPMKSAAEIDQEFEKSAKFMAAMGADGMKRLSELSSSAIESMETNLFSFSPEMSYVGEGWIKADPDFWKPKRAARPAAAPKKTEEKPAASN
jgi:hypothetical protein